jgi:serine/threonine-protein kinase
VEYGPGASIPGTPYTIVRLLEHGGQSIVYEATNAIGKPVVLKVVRPTLLGQEFASRLEDEAKLLARLDHPNIIAAHDLRVTTEDPPRVFIVMERLRGQNLREVLARRKRVDLPIALEIGASVAEALAYTHAAGVVHLDVKPANVFVHIDAKGRPVIKLLDFGFMRMVGPNGATKSLSGTPTYAAPEQLLDSVASARSDIYALGLVLYELLTGKRPFSMDEGVMAVVNARLSRPAPPLSRWALVPEEVEHLVLSCIERRPDLRPAKAGDVALALWEARRRALGPKRRTDPFATVESLVGLARETRPTPVLKAKARGEDSQRTQPPLASNDLQRAWFAHGEAIEQEATTRADVSRPRSRAPLTLSAAALLLLAGLGGWAAARRSAHAQAVAPGSLPTITGAALPARQAAATIPPSTVPASRSPPPSALAPRTAEEPPAQIEVGAHASRGAP